MPHNITETSTFSDAAVALPDNGEVDGIESIEPAITAAMNRARLARDLLLGHLSWSGDFAVSGSSTVFTVTIGAINEVCLSTAGSPIEYFPHSSSGGTASLANVEGAPGALSGDTWYYAYAYRSGTNLAYEISITAPNASRVFKTSNATRRFLGRFRTDSTGAPVTVAASHGCYRYRDRAAAAVLHQNETTANINTFTSALSLAALVPSTARVALVRLQVARTGSGGDAIAAIRVNGDTNPAATVSVPGLPLLFVDDRFIEMDVGASREVQVATNGSSTLVNVDVAGWRE